MNTPQVENLEQWINDTRPDNWEEWEWLRFLCSIGRLFITQASQETGLTAQQIILFLTHPEIERPQ